MWWCKRKSWMKQKEIYSYKPIRSHVKLFCHKICSYKYMLLHVRKQKLPDSCQPAWHSQALTWLEVGLILTAGLWWSLIEHKRFPSTPSSSRVAGDQDGLKQNKTSVKSVWAHFPETEHCPSCRNDHTPAPLFWLLSVMADSLPMTASALIRIIKIPSTKPPPLLTAFRQTETRCFESTLNYFAQTHTIWAFLTLWLGYARFLICVDSFPAMNRQTQISTIKVVFLIVVKRRAMTHILALFIDKSN